VGLEQYLFGSNGSPLSNFSATVPTQSSIASVIEMLMFLIFPVVRVGDKCVLTTFHLSSKNGQKEATLTSIFSTSVVNNTAKLEGLA